MNQELILIAGTLQIAPIGQDEWCVNFFPELDFPRGTTRDLPQSEVIIYLRKLKVKETFISEIANFDFSCCELRPFEIFVTVPSNLLRYYGFTSDRTV